MTCLVVQSKSGSTGVRMRIIFAIVFYLLSAKIGCIVSEGTSCTCSAGGPNNDILQEFKDIKDQLRIIEAQLKTLHTIVEQKVESSGQNYSVIKIIDAIKNREFELAKDLLFGLANSIITQIVHDIYEGSPENVDLILEFAKELNDIGAKFEIFCALGDEMKSNRENDLSKLIALVEAVEGELAGDQQIDTDIRSNAQSVVDYTLNNIKGQSINILKTAMVQDSYKNDVKVNTLANTLFRFKSDLFREVIERVVNSVFGVVAVDKVLDNVASHKYISQVITGLKAVYYRFHVASDINSDTILNFASHLRDLQLRQDFNPLDQKFNDEINEMVERLPTCARTLYFNTNVCFWNKGKQAYIYAANVKISHDKNRRSIYSWHTGNVVSGSLWYVEKIGDYYFFKNHNYTNEYLYSVNGGAYNNNMRYVFTWIPGHNTDHQSAWRIELDGDYCFIKSAYNNEYLFASSIAYNEYNNYVFTWIGKTILQRPEFQWQLRDCGPKDVTDMD